MPLRDKIRKLKSDAKSRIFHVDEVKENIQAGAGQTGATPTSSTTHSWPHLRALLGTLEQVTKPLAPLKAAVSEIIECVDIFERGSQRKEYEDLYNELEGLFQALQSYCAESTPPAITTTVEALCESIQNEIAGIHQTLGKGKRRAYLEAEQDMDALLACYRRIHLYLQRISLNVDMSVWRIVDETATDNRLDRLSPSLSARYNSAQAIELKRGPCTKDTRSSSGSVYWMSGMAGTGKTTIAYSLCLELQTHQRLAASFFCSRLLPECRDVKLIMPSIAYQLARFSRPFRFVLSRVLEKDPDVHTQLTHIQFNVLIAQPLLEIKDTLPDSLVVVIDALDECENKESTSRVLDVLLTESSNLPIKFIVSSRPEPEIRDEMTKQSNQTRSRVVLHELDRHAVQADIETYLKATLAEIQPTEEQIAMLVERAGILFIYAATVVRYISHDRFRRNPRARLTNVLESSASENKHKEIDELYGIILQSALDDPALDRAEREDMLLVLHTVICAQEPLAVEALSALLKMHDPNRVRVALRPLWSVLHISGASELVTTLHASFPDYIFDPLRSKKYYCDSALHNQTISLLCFDLFSTIHPRFNICGLQSSYVPDDEIEGLEARIQAVVSLELFYVAQNWGTHLRSAIVSPDLVYRLERFLSTQLLLWMEVMNLKKCTGSVPHILQLIEKWEGELPASLNALIHDAWRFTSTFALGAASNSTPHIYTSTLLFWPEHNPVARCYKGHTKGLINTEGTAIDRREHALLAMWCLDQGSVAILSPSFSPDGTLVAVGVISKVYLLNSSNGRMILPPFEGTCGNCLSSIQFSPDGTRIVSGTHNTIYVWSTQNGKMLLGPLKGRTELIISQVAFSPDGTRIVSGPSICVWDAFSGEHIMGPLEFNCAFWHTFSIKYSPDGCWIISHGTEGILIYDAEGRQALRVLGSDVYNSSHYCTSIDISPDGTRIASGCNHNSICIWDFDTGEMVLGPLNMTASTSHCLGISVSFSPDGLHLVSGSEGGIFMWDTLSGNLIFGPLGRSIGCQTVYFSPDGASLISSAYGRMVYFWDARSAHTTVLGPLHGHTHSVIVGISPDGTHIISTSNDRTVCVWDIKSGELVLGPLELTIDFMKSVAFSAEGNHIISSIELELILTDAQPDNITFEQLQRHYHSLSTGFSPDGACIFSAVETLQTSNLTAGPSSSIIVRIQAANTGQTLMVIHHDHSLAPIKDPDYCILLSRLRSRVKISPDGTYIAVRSDFSDAPSLYPHTLYLYDVRSGRLLHDKLCGCFFSYGFSPDGTRVVSCSRSTILLRDVKSGRKLLDPLEGHSEQVNSVEFSPDGSYIVSGAEDRALCIWEALTGQLVLGPVKWHTGPVKSVKFSLDSTCVVSGSGDAAIRVTDIRAVPSTIPYSSPVGFGEWELREDGWVVDDLSRLLVWIPPDLRTSLMYPRTKLLISRQGYLRLNFEGAHIGESWAKCYRPV
ncbi:quinon protein alcohol dehydrogenase-like superfamily [Rhizoctonia solani]|nr:quinon protein alcohol dehydrogenase-like superfamily [Rhizoctonia solani]